MVVTADAAVPAGRGGRDRGHRRLRGRPHHQPLGVRAATWAGPLCRPGKDREGELAPPRRTCGRLDACRDRPARLAPPACSWPWRWSAFRHRRAGRALARERVRPPRELARQVPAGRGQDAAQVRPRARPSARWPPQPPRARWRARTAVAATPEDEDDDGTPLLGFVLVALGASMLAGGAVWTSRAPSAAPEQGSLATSAPAATLRAAPPPAASPRRRTPKQRARSGTAADRHPRAAAVR